MLTVHPIIVSTVLATLLFLQGCAGVLVAGAATTAAVANDRRTIGNQLDDKNLEFKAEARLRDRKDIWDNANLSVSSMNGVLLVVGQVPTKHLHSETSKILKELPNVRQLHNQVKVATPASLSTQSNDAWITTQVKSKLLNDEASSALQIKVITENSEVYLMGIVNREEATRATEVARNVKGVTRVVRVFEYIEDRNI